MSSQGDFDYWRGVVQKSIFHPVANPRAHLEIPLGLVVLVRPLKQWFMFFIFPPLL